MRRVVHLVKIFLCRIVHKIVIEGDSVPSATFGDHAARVKERLEIPIDVLISRGEITAPKSPPLSPGIKKSLIGRPPKYHPSYCDLVIEMASEGHSVGAVAGRIGVNRSTLLNWTRLFPEFCVACSRAAAAKLYFWETKLIHVANTGGAGSQGQIAIFGVVNASRTLDRLDLPDWAQKQEIEHSGSASLAGVVDRMMAKLDEIARSHQQPGDNAKVIDGDPPASAEEFW